MQTEPASRDIVVIGASAGGVEALTRVIGSLPGDLAAAVFVVLHIPAHTRSELAAILQRGTSLAVAVPADGDPIRVGRVYVAGTDRHLMLEENTIRITRGPKECRARPSIDVLFRSAAAAFGPRVIGVILTGMLDDGTAGLWAVKDCGGTAVVQLPADAMYDSMPASAIQHVAVDVIAPLAELSAKIAALVGTPAAGLAAHPAHPQRRSVETLIARSGNGLEAGVMKIGELSQYTCPACNGVLVQIEEGPIVRFRCHTGHAYSLKTLIAEVNAAVDDGLWDTLRAIEERVLLLRQMAELARKGGLHAEADRCARQVAQAEERIAPLRALVLDPRVTGRDPPD